MSACDACGAVGQSADVLRCPTCRALLPLDPRATPFTRLGLPAPTDDIDPAALEALWLERSRQVHPDRFATASDAIRRRAVEQTAALNDAYKLLSDRLARAAWLLTHAGVALDVKLPLDTLVRAMTLREDASEGHAPRALADARAWERDVEAALHGGLRDVLAGRATQLAAIAERLAELKTLARLRAEIEAHLSRQGASGA